MDCGACNRESDSGVASATTSDSRSDEDRWEEGLTKKGRGNEDSTVPPEPFGPMGVAAISLSLAAQDERASLRASLRDLAAKTHRRYAPYLWDRVQGAPPEEMLLHCEKARQRRTVLFRRNPKGRWVLPATQRSQENGVFRAATTRGRTRKAHRRRCHYLCYRLLGVCAAEETRYYMSMLSAAHTHYAVVTMTQNRSTAQTPSPDYSWLSSRSGGDAARQGREGGVSGSNAEAGPLAQRRICECIRRCSRQFMNNPG